MKSPMVASVDPVHQEGYTELRVLHSNAGYYIGTMYRNVDEDGKLLFEEPGSRDSDYFRTREEAERFLKTVEDSELYGALRQTP